MDEIWKYPKQCSDGLRTKTTQELATFQSQMRFSSKEDLLAYLPSLLSKIQCLTEDKDRLESEKKALINSRASILDEKEKIAKERDEAVAEKEKVKEENQSLRNENQELLRVQCEMEKTVIRYEEKGKRAASEAELRKKMYEQQEDFLKITKERLEKAEMELDKIKNQEATKESPYERCLALGAGDKIPTESSSDDSEFYESIEEQEEPEVPVEMQNPPPLPSPRDAPPRKSGKKNVIRRFMGKNKSVKVQGNNNMVNIGAVDTQGGSLDNIKSVYEVSQAVHMRPSNEYITMQTTI